MKLRLLKTKPKGIIKGRCAYPNCNNPCSCFWKRKAVCSEHYFLMRKFYSLNMKIKRRQSK